MHNFRYQKRIQRVARWQYCWDPPFCVGFAAEPEDVVENARRKLASKKVAMIVGNRAQDAFGAEGSELVVIDAGGVTPLPHAGKLAQARRVIARIAARMGMR